MYFREEAIMDNMTKRDVYRFMDAIENGMIPLEEVQVIAEEMDPLLLYFIFRYLKETYGRETQGPSERLLQFFARFPELAKHAKPPKGEAMVEWFDDTYTVHTFKNRDSYIDTIIDKLEG